MVDTLTEALRHRLDGSENLPLVVALMSLATIALFPLTGPSLKWDLSHLGQALTALTAIVRL